MSHDDFDFEPIRGLPALLPPGERLLWQGSPCWKSLAIHAYHARKAALYFLALTGWRIGLGIYRGDPVADIAVSCALLVLLGSIATAVLVALAYLGARSAVFSITSRRVLLRHGIAVPMTLDVPFKTIQSASLKVTKGAIGDIAIEVTARERVGYLITWPYLKPGHLAHPQPSLRALADAPGAARVLGAALAIDAGQTIVPSAYNDGSHSDSRAATATAVTTASTAAAASTAATLTAAAQAAAVQARAAAA